MKKLTAILFLLMITLSLAGCRNISQPNVEEVVADELDRLKDLDTKTVRQYLSADRLFPNAEETDSTPELMEEFISLYFDNFNYKILRINVDGDSAAASLRLNTLDAQALARDFSSSYLKQEIYFAANSGGQTTPPKTSLDDHYRLLNQLIRDNNYKTVENNCTMYLKKGDSGWAIQRNDNLENDIIGGFISSITNPNLLTPGETLEIYLSTLKDLDDVQLTNYLGISDMLQDGDPARSGLTSALLKQARDFYSYKIGHVTQDDFSAVVDTEISTFDYNSILDTYNKKSEQYLATPQAIYDGQEGRLSKSREMLLECVTGNTKSTSVTVPVQMVNDGFSWTLVDASSIGNAIFGAVSPPENDAGEDVSSDESSEDDYSEDSSSEDDYSEEDSSEEE